MLAVLLSALYAGFIAGLLAGTVTILFASFALLPTESIREPSATGAYHIAMFAVVATAISLLASRRSRAEATLQATLASMGDGVIVTDVDGRVIFLNGVAEHLTSGRPAARGNRTLSSAKPEACHRHRRVI